MKFRFRDAPEWFSDHLIKNYIDELHLLEKEAKTINPEFKDLDFKQVAVDFFTEKGFTTWLDNKNHIWFEIDPNSPQWTFEILRG